MKMSSIVLCTVLVFAPSWPSAAGGSDRLSLEGALLLSIKNNNKLLIAVEKTRESAYRVRETWGMLWPEISTDVSMTRLGSESGYSSSIDGQYDIKIVNGKLAVNPGVFYNSLQATRKGHLAAEKEVRRVKAEITIQCIRLYYQTLMAREMVKLYGESVKLLDENLKVSTTGYQKGMFSKLDFLRAKVAHANERTKFINARNDFRSACAALNIHMGRDIHDPLELVEDALTHPVIPGKDQDDERAVREMTALALQNRPELIQLRLKKEINRHSGMAAASVYLWPTFFASGNAGYTKMITKPQSSSSDLIGVVSPQTWMYSSAMTKMLAPSGWNQNWSVTLGATYRWSALSPVDSNHAKSKAYTSQGAQTDQELDEFVKAVRLEIERGHLKLKSAELSLDSQKGNIETAEESLKAASLQFRSGIIDNTKLIEANVQLLTAKTLYLQALNDLQLAKAELNRAMGRDYFTIE